jgi:hypothetical protein
MRKVKGGKGGEIHLLEKGETANPYGRPKGSKNRSTILRKWLETKEKIKNPITGAEEQVTVEDAVILALIGKARKGDVAAIREILDSNYGKLTDSFSIETSDIKKTVSDLFPPDIIDSVKDVPPES